MNFARDLKVQHVAVSLTQTFNTRLVGQITYEMTYADGRGRQVIRLTGQ